MYTPKHNIDDVFVGSGFTNCKIVDINNWNNTPHYQIRFYNENDTEYRFGNIPCEIADTMVLWSGPFTFTEDDMLVPEIRKDVKTKNWYDKDLR